MSPSATRSIARKFAAGAAIAALSVIGVVAVPMSASAATFTVTSTADDGSAGTLRFEILAANAAAGADTIRFSAAIPTNSVIELDTTISITEDLVIDGSGVSGLTVAGGVAANYGLLQVEPSAAGQSFVFTNFTIDGNAGIPGWTGWGIYGATGGGGASVQSLTLDGMTLRDITGPFGSAFYVFATGVAGTISITDTTIENNTATLAEGAVSLRGVQDSITITNSTFDGNVASSDGGAALFIEGNAGGRPSLSVTGSTFTANQALGGSGGAIFANVLASASITSSEFTSNISSLAGGAVAFGSIDSDGSFDVLNSVFDSNLADASGGAVYLDDAAVETTIENNTFIANQADGVDGGALAFGSVSATLSIFSNTFTQNLAPAARGGVSISIVSIVADTIVAIGNSTFLEQDTGNGAAIAVTTEVESGAQLFVVSCTLLGMGAIYLEQNNGQVIISNSIIDGDVNSLGVDTIDLAGGSVVGIEWSVVADAFDGATMVSGSGNKFSTAAVLGPLQNNGGPTSTMALLAGSPAINAGDPAYIYPFTEDQRGAGFNRIVAGRVDIGAFEVQLPTLAATGTDISPMVPIGAGALVLLGIATLVFSRRRRVA